MSASFALAIQEECNPLHGIKLFEIVDAAKAERYLKSPHMTDKYDKGREIKGYSSPSQQLRNYIKNYMATYDAIPVVYNRSKSKFGRVHPKDSLALCSIPRVIRNTLIHKTYYDFDLVNAQPAILRAVLNANNYKVAEQFPALEKYVTERETIIQQVMQYHSVSRKSAKDYFIHVAFGKPFKSWQQAQEIALVPNCIEHYENFKLMQDYEREIQEITGMIIEANQPLFDKYRDAYRKKPENEKKFNELGSFMSMYLQEMETRVVGRVMDWVINNTGCTAFKNARGSTYHVASYQFDGIQLLQESVNEFDGGLDGFIAALNQQTAELTNLHGIQWICKPMTDDMNKAFEEEEAKREADAEIDQHMQQIQEENKKDRKQTADDPNAIYIDNADDEQVCAAVYDHIKPEVVYSRGQMFFKMDHLWNNDATTFPSCLRNKIIALPIYNRLHTKQETKVFKYCGMVKSLKNVATLVEDKIRQNPDNLFYEKLHDSTRGKLAFEDGVYDFPSGKFHEWDSEHLKCNPVYFVAKAPRKFPKAEDVDAKFKADCIQTVFINNLGIEQSKLWLHCLSRALAGHIEDKRWTAQITNRNAGKGVQNDWLKRTFGPYVTAADYTNFLTKQFNAGDAAKSNGWLMPHQFSRLMCVNEAQGNVNSKTCLLDSGILKSINSGGDTIEARQMRCDPAMINLQCMVVFFLNDIAGATTADVFEQCLEIRSTGQFKSKEFIDGELAATMNAEGEIVNQQLYDYLSTNYKVGDPELRNKIKQDDWCNALVRIIIDNYHAKEVPLSTKEVEDDEVSAAKLILARYEEAGSNHFVSNSDLREFAEESKMSLKKLKTEIKSIFKHVYEGKAGSKSEIKCLRGIKDRFAESEEAIAGNENPSH